MRTIFDPPSPIDTFFITKRYYYRHKSFEPLPCLDRDLFYGRPLRQNICRIQTSTEQSFDQNISNSQVYLFLFRLDGGYAIQNYEGKAKALRTNVSSNTAMRGFGGPEGAIVIEEIIHRIAHILKRDPNEIKKVVIRP
jgi:hypothetical protein